MISFTEGFKLSGTHQNRHDRKEEEEQEEEEEEWRDLEQCCLQFQALEQRPFLFMRSYMTFLGR